MPMVVKNTVNGETSGSEYSFKTFSLIERIGTAGRMGNLPSRWCNAHQTMRSSEP